MLANIGNYLLIIAIASLLFGVASPRHWGKKAPLAAFISLSLAVLILIYSYVINDFSLASVYVSSHSNIAVIYKLAALWTTNEGSMLLWSLVLLVYLMAFSFCARQGQIKEITIIIQSIICVIFLFFSWYAADPFQKLLVSSTEGRGLNPVLQDVALTIHPPILYIGYVGYSIIFSLALSILLTADFNNRGQETSETTEAFKLLNIYALIAFGFLTLGVGLGSWWAYRELGWGGFWFWDPVENVSILPWLLGLGLIHALFSTKKWHKLEFLTLFLSIASFLSSLLGTFITRAGIIDSLHTFANDQEKGFYLLLIFSLLAITSFSIFTAKLYSYFKNNFNNKDFSHSKDSPNKNYFLILINIIGCFILFLCTLGGILAPLIIKLFYGSNIYVSGSFYNNIFSKIAIILSLGIILFPFASFKAFLKRYSFSFILMPFAIILLLYNNIIGFKFTAELLSSSNVLGLLAFFGCFVIFTTTEYLIRSVKAMKKLTTSKAAFYFSHMGFGLLLLAISLNISGSQLRKKYFNIGDSLTIASTYNFVLESSNIIKNDNFNALRGNFRINNSHVLSPEFRFYKRENMPNAEADILHHNLHDLYIIISGVDEKLGFATEIYYKPFMSLIWLSIFIILLGVGLKLVSAGHILFRKKTLLQDSIAKG